MAIIKYQQGERVPSLLSLYYFLLLEPASGRAATAYRLLKEQLGGNVQKDENDPKNIEILINPKTMETEFSAADLMLAMLEASNTLEENKDKTSEELFMNTTKSFFHALGELQENEQRSNLWWDFYVPVFYELGKSEFIDVFCHFISISSNEKSREWLGANHDKFERFAKWMNDASSNAFK